MKIEHIVRGVLTPDLLLPKWRAKIRRGDHPTKGHCYAAAEAAYHLDGRDRGFTPCWLRMRNGGTHWFLRRYDKVIDPTVRQFKRTPLYSRGHGCGFLTRQPSKRAQIIIDRIMERGLWGSK